MPRPPQEGDEPGRLLRARKRYLFLITLAGGEQRRVHCSDTSVEQAWELAFANLPDVDKERVRGYLVLSEEPCAD